MEEEVLEILQRNAVLLTGGHYVYTKHDHSDTYFLKDRLLASPRDTSTICRRLAVHFLNDKVEVVVGPALGGIALSQWVAHHLSVIGGTGVSAAYAEKVDGVMQLHREYDKLVAGKRVLVVEDTTSTGISAREVVEVVRNCGGNVVGLGVINNGGWVTAQDVGDVPRLVALVSLSARRYQRGDCPMCKNNVPIRRSPGHGKDFEKEYPDYPGGFVD